MQRQPMPPRRVALARTVKLTRQPAQAARKRPKPAGWSADTRAIVRARSGGICEVGAVGCLITATNLHHRLPLRMGGNRNPALRTAANALAVCGQGNASGCHQFLDRHSRLAAVAGWKLHAGADPTVEPVRYRCRDLVWLTEQGGIVGARGAA
jgi:hypothetical protein